MRWKMVGMVGRKVSQRLQQANAAAVGVQAMNVVQDQRLMAVFACRKMQQHRHLPAASLGSEPDYRRLRQVGPFSASIFGRVR
jgi:hypothetical protein